MRLSLDDSAFHLTLSEVSAKHFRQDTANLKNLTLCNQKHPLFFYLLGKCFAPTSVGRINREPRMGLLHSPTRRLAWSLLLTCGGLSFWMERSGMKNPLCPLPLLRRFFAALLLTCCGASTPRYDSTCYLALSEVRAKHFRQDAANSKNLTLCNQKHWLFLYLLGKCFAPTNVGRITREPDAVPIPSSQFLIPN